MSQIAKISMFAAATVLLGAGCAQQPAANSIAAPPASAAITYYTSDQPSTTFCNGADMDGAGYKNALNKPVTKTVPGVLSVADKIKRTLEMAVADSDFKDSPYAQVDKMAWADGIVTMRQASGWAGSSIFMCAWQPFVEKQLEQFPEVKSIKWEPVS